jgi:hemerythrin
VGIRSSDEEHMKVVDLLNSSLSDKFKDISQKSQTAKRVIAKKNLIEYENRNFIQSEALEMIKQVQRFYNWATRNLQV